MVVYIVKTQDFISVLPTATELSQEIQKNHISGERIAGIHPQKSHLFKVAPIKTQDSRYELFSPTVASILSSPLDRFTTLFGMGRSGASPLQ